MDKSCNAICHSACKPWRYITRNCYHKETESHACPTQGDPNTTHYYPGSVQIIFPLMAVKVPAKSVPEHLEGKIKVTQTTQTSVTLCDTSHSPFTHYQEGVDGLTNAKKKKSLF